MSVANREPYDQPLGAGTYVAFAASILVFVAAAFLGQSGILRTISLVGIGILLFGFALQQVGVRLGAYVMAVVGLLSLPVGIPAVLVALEGLHGAKREDFFSTVRPEPVHRAFYNKFAGLFIGLGIALLVVGVISAMVAGAGMSLTGGAMLLFVGVMNSKRPLVAVHASYLALRPTVLSERRIAWRDVAFLRAEADVVRIGFRGGDEDALIRLNGFNDDDRATLFSTLERAHGAATQSAADSVSIAA